MKLLKHLSDVSQRHSGGIEVLCGLQQFVELRLSPMVDPCLGVLFHFLPFPDRRSSNLGRELFEGPQLALYGWMLATGAKTVRE